MTEALLAERLLALIAAERTKVGFPGWSAPLPAVLTAFFAYELNNYGDPGTDPVFAWHTKDLERELVGELADVFGAAPGRHWGYVTSGGGEGVLAGLWEARRRHPGARVYHSTAAHASVARAADLLRMDAVAVPAGPRGEMDYAALERLVRGRPAIVLATVGTTLTEAVDDVPRIRATLRRAGATGGYVHADAALAGLPLALASAGPPPFGLTGAGADSLSISGHKFLGVPFPCGVYLARRAPGVAADPGDLMCGAPDALSSSRSGHAALILWYLMRRHGRDGLRELADRGRATAEYAERALTAAGWPAWRAHPQARTVVFATPPRPVPRDWPMPSVGGLSHIVCTPGVTRARIDLFVAAVAEAAHAHPRSELVCQPH
ncbi:MULTISPECIES: aminotransferase class V-fold PLP-dependent enzyme [Catenuloplanes]|uniref:Histidine decarboxylase n=1 Tax=Catenuloplanes niger TaxID=587534 RepID=A0AAE4CW90_9ACTN|nr:aminotransferase class V-fold PLP-dependent enzyme [Catenuloplanes niger]MDR7326980.1 histidine decarboxylase [Catenuloplanes niger]